MNELLSDDYEAQLSLSFVLFQWSIKELFALSVDALNDIEYHAFYVNQNNFKGSLSSSLSTISFSSWLSVWIRIPQNYSAPIESQNFSAARKFVLNF